MVLPLEEAIQRIAQNTDVMAKQLPSITDSVIKLYKTEEKEAKKEEKNKVKQERDKADRASGKGPNKNIIKELAGLNASMKEVRKLLKEGNKETQNTLNTVFNSLKSLILTSCISKNFDS